MGRVLVKAPQPTAAQSAGNILEQLLPMPKTRLGGFAGGTLGTIAFLDALADAGASEQDLVSGLNTGAQRAYGMLSGGGRAGDIASSGASGAYQKIRGKPTHEENLASAAAAFDAAVPTTGSRIDASGPIDPSTGLPSNIQVNPITNLAPAEHYQTQMAEQAKRAEERTDPSNLAFDPDFGESQLGRIGTRSPLSGRYHAPGGGFSADIFSSNYPQTSAYQSAVASIPAPPTNNDDDMSSMAEDSMGGDIDVSHSGEGAELDPDAAAIMGAGTEKPPFDIKELEGVTMPEGYKMSGEPMDVAFRLLKFRTWENE